MTEPKRFLRLLDLWHDLYANGHYRSAEVVWRLRCWLFDRQRHNLPTADDAKGVLRGD